MAADRVITCVNKDGESITFTEDMFAPFILVSADGIYDAVNKVNMSENTMVDGGIYQGSTAKYRNIVLTVKDRTVTPGAGAKTGDVYISYAVIHGKTLEILDAYEVTEKVGGQSFVDHRDLLDKVFKRNSIGRLTFKEGDEERVIDYYVEYVKSTGTHTFRHHTISLICPDPFFYDPYDIQTHFAAWISDFEFIHEFSDEGEEFGHKMSDYEDVYNESADENIGITAVISCNGAVLNPSITHMELNEHVKVGETGNALTLTAGDLLTITTGTGNKHIYLTHNGTTEEINQYMTEDSEFIQLMRGHNHISFDADSGKNNIEMTITYRLRHVRA